MVSFVEQINRGIASETASQTFLKRVANLFTSAVLVNGVASLVLKTAFMATFRAVFAQVMIQEWIIVNSYLLLKQHFFTVETPWTLTREEKIIFHVAFTIFNLAYISKLIFVTGSPLIYRTVSISELYGTLFGYITVVSDLATTY